MQLEFLKMIGFIFGYGSDLYLYNNCFTRGGGTYKSYYDIPTTNELN